MILGRKYNVLTFMSYLLYASSIRKTRLAFCVAEVIPDLRWNQAWSITLNPNIFLLILFLSKGECLNKMRLHVRLKKWGNCLSCPHPPTSYEGRREQGRQLSFWWETLNLIRHDGSGLVKSMLIRSKYRKAVWNSIHCTRYTAKNLISYL